MRPRKCLRSTWLHGSALYWLTNSQELIYMDLTAIIDSMAVDHNENIYDYTIILYLHISLASRCLRFIKNIFYELIIIWIKKSIFISFFVYQIKFTYSVMGLMKFVEFEIYKFFFVTVCSIMICVLCLLVWESWKILWIICYCFFRLEFFKRDINVFSKLLQLKDSQLKEIDLACNSFLKNFKP